MGKITANVCYMAFSISLNVILLLYVFNEATIPRSSAPTKSVNPKADIKPTESRPVFRSTKESLYDMYGEGEFSDTDEHLLDYIRSMMSQRAPGGYNLNKNKTHYSQMGGSQLVDKLLQQRRNGFFVECGAFRGEDLSDTLFFELHRNWTAILIEPVLEYHREIGLLTKNRRALVLRACLSPSRRPGALTFRLHGWGSGVSTLNINVDPGDKQTAETQVQCFTLNSVMAVIGVRHIDFMVLDVEGAEIPVLETIDWTRLSIDVFNIEYAEDHPAKRIEKLNRLRSFFNTTGRRRPKYKEVWRLPPWVSERNSQDVLFMRV